MFQSYLAIILACLIAYRLNRHFLPTYFRFVQYLLIVVLIFELSGFILKQAAINQHPLDHLYQPIEFGLLSIIYYYAIINFKLRKLMLPVFICYLMISLYTSLYVEGLYHPNTASFIGESVLIILYSIIYVYTLFSMPPSQESLLKNPFFWINTAHLFFYCGTFFQMGLDSYIREKDAALANQLVIINYCLNFTLYILYFIGLLCNRIFKF